MWSNYIQNLDSTIGLGIRVLVYEIYSITCEKFINNPDNQINLYFLACSKVNPIVVPCNNRT